MEKFKGERVLLISDDQILNKLLGCVLESHGVALDQISGEPDQDKLGSSLVIYDTPYLGFDKKSSCSFPENLLKNSNPRIVISTSPIDCDKCTSKMINMCSFFLKPFDIDKVIEKVKSHMPEYFN